MLVRKKTQVDIRTKLWGTKISLIVTMIFQFVPPNILDTNDLLCT